MTAADTEGGLLRAIAADPADDTVRLAYADWLEENAGEVECRACLGTGSHALDPYDLAARYGRAAATKIIDGAKCSACGGSGRVGDGKRERAEFIRVQVELAAGGCLPGLCICTRGCDELRRRERELKGDSAGNGTRRTFECWADDFDSLRWLLTTGGSVDYARGFVAEVRCPLDVLLGGACGRCGGDGGVGGFDGEDPPDDCPDCGGTGRTEGVARELFAAHPVARVVATDKRPWDDGTGSPSDFSWWRASCWDGEGDSNRGNLPDEILDAVAAANPGNRLIWGGPPSNQHVAFDTAEDAREALSRALVAVCRERAGLPELPR